MNRALWAFFFLVPLLFVPYIDAENFEVPKVVLLEVAAAACLCFLPLRAWRPGGDWAAWGAYAILASAALSTALARDPKVALFGEWLSFEGLFVVAAYTALYFGVRHHGASCLAGAVYAAPLVGLYAIAQVIGLDPIAWNRTSPIGDYVRPFASLGNPVHLGAWAAGVLPLAMDRRCFVGAAGAGAAAATVLMALSRAAWIGAAIGALVFFVGCAAVRERLDGPYSDRVEIWKSAFAMWRAHPVVGVGLDNFERAFGQYRTAAYRRAEVNTMPTKAHNVVMHIAATQGSIGLFAYGLFVVGVVRNALARRQRALLACVAAISAAWMAGFAVAATGSLFVGASAALAHRNPKEALT